MHAEGGPDKIPFLLRRAPAPRGHNVLEFTRKCRTGCRAPHLFRTSGKGGAAFFPLSQMYAIPPRSLLKTLPRRSALAAALDSKPCMPLGMSQLPAYHFS